MDIDGIGQMAFDQDSQLYEGSDIDVYLSNNYYNSLPFKDAIVPRNIRQKFYEKSYDNPNYHFVTTDEDANLNHNGCKYWCVNDHEENKWLEWDKHQPVKGEPGAFKFTEKGYTRGNITTNTLNRLITLPSIDDIKHIVNPDYEYDMDRLLRDLNNEHIFTWLLDANYSHDNSVLFGDCSTRSLSTYDITTNLWIHPIFMVDLNKISLINTEQDFIVFNEKPNNILTIGGCNYVVLDDLGQNEHLVLDIDGIGLHHFNVNGNGQDPNKCKFDDATGRYLSETCNNQYEGSTIDGYLNGDYYNSLPQNVKGAIVETDIQQSYYAHTDSNPNYKWVDKNDTSHDGCNNRVCAIQPDGHWIPWNQHTPVKGEAGAYKFKRQGDTDNFGNKANIIKRRIFLPSVNEISSIVDVNDQQDMDKLLRKSNGDYINMWFRDGRDTHNTHIIHGDYAHRSLNNFNVSHKSVVARPAFVIDLYKSNYTNTKNKLI